MKHFLFVLSNNSTKNNTHYKLSYIGENFLLTSLKIYVYETVNLVPSLLHIVEDQHQNTGKGMIYSKYKE